MTDDAATWRLETDIALTGLAGEWMKTLEALLPPESGTIVVMYNKVGDPAHIVVMTLNDDNGIGLRVLHEATALLRKRTADASGGERHFVTRFLGRGMVTADTPPAKLLISSAIVSSVGAHDCVRMWNRGGLAGELVLVAGDGERFCTALGMVELP